MYVNSDAATKENPNGSVQLLERKCTQFQKQIYEMEARLCYANVIYSFNKLFSIL